MKITKRMLKQIIKQEMKNVLLEVENQNLKNADRHLSNNDLPRAIASLTAAVQDILNMPALAAPEGIPRK